MQTFIEAREDSTRDSNDLQPLKEDLEKEEECQGEAEEDEEAIDKKLVKQKYQEPKKIQISGKKKHRE